MDKSELRKDISEKRELLDETIVKNASETILTTLQSLSDIKTSKAILSYMPKGNEVDIKPLNQWILDQGKILCLPRVISQTEMEVRVITNVNNGLKKSSYCIFEPTDSHELIDIGNIDLILVPGVAFDKSGNRMGHGKGYYDRFLARCKDSTTFIGIAYSFQVFDTILSDQYDVKMDRIITEKYTIESNRK